MTDLAEYRLDFTPEERLGTAEAPPQDWKRHDQMIRAVAATEMKPDQTTLHKLLTGAALRVPEYQRDYSWEEQNWEPLWNDIISVTGAQLGSGRKAQDIFFGILFVAESDQQNVDLDVIDGQQRITTVGLIIRALLSHMEGIEESAIQADSCRQYRRAFTAKAESYLFRDYGEFGLRQPRLVLDEVNRREYLLIVSSDSDRPHILRQIERTHGNARRNAIKTTRLLSLLGAEFDVPADVPHNLHVPETSKLLLHGYAFFRERIERELIDFTADQRVRLLANLLDYVMHCLSITVFRLGRAHPELLMDVFEALNNRGMELALTDVVNARIVQRFSATDAIDGRSRIHQWRKTMDQFGRHYESLRDYLVDYLTSMFPENGSRTFHVDRLLEAFSHQKAADDGKTHDPPLLHDLETAGRTIDALENGASLYAYLIDASAETLDFGDDKANERIRDSLRRLQALQTRQWRALILTTGLAVTKSPTRERAIWLSEVVDAVERLAIRQSICGVNPNRLEEVFRKAIQRLRDTPFNREAVKHLWSDFRSEYGTVVQQESFVEALTKKEDWGNNLSKVLLWRTFAAGHADDEMVLRRLNTSEVHLEHVMPQAPFDEKSDRQPWLAGLFSGDERYVDVEEEIKLNAELREAFLEDVVALIVRDIGNTILLKDSVNKSIKNTTLAWKLVSYESTPGFVDIDVNEPLASWDWKEDQVQLRDQIRKLRELKEGRLGIEAVRPGYQNVDEEIEALKQDIERHEAKPQVDVAWTAVRLAERRSAFLAEAIRNLGMPGEELAASYSEKSAKDVISTRIDTILSRLQTT